MRRRGRRTVLLHGRRRIVEERDRQTGGNDLTRTKYKFGLSFQTADGTAVQIQERVGRDEYAAVETGGTIALFYLPMRPDFVEFSQGDKRKATGFRRCALLALAIVLAGVTVSLKHRPTAKV